MQEAVRLFGPFLLVALGFLAEMTGATKAALAIYVVAIITAINGLHAIK